MSSGQEVIGITGTWGHLPFGSKGPDPIRQIPLDRWDADSNAITAPTGARFGGFVSDWSSFDAAAFAIASAEAAVMDPQQRLLLEVGGSCGAELSIHG